MQSNHHPAWDRLSPLDGTSADTDSWKDILGIEQDAVFVVAGAKGALLEDLRREVDKAIELGTTLKEFQAQFDQIVDRRGWNYTGNRDWRSQLIWETNLRASYGAGREAQIQRVKQRRPFAQWRHGGSADPRPEHIANDGRVYRVDERPTNLPHGYGCFAEGTEVLTPSGWKAIESIKTGDVVVGGSGMNRLVVAAHRLSYDGPAIRVVDENGLGEFTATPNHRILTADGWIRADAIKPGDKLVQLFKDTGFDAAVGNVDKGDPRFCDVEMPLPGDSLVAEALDAQPQVRKKSVNPVMGNVVVVDDPVPQTSKVFNDNPFALNWESLGVRVSSWIFNISFLPRLDCLCSDLGIIEARSSFKVLSQASDGLRVLLGFAASRMRVRLPDFLQSPPRDFSPIRITNVLHFHSFASVETKASTFEYQRKPAITHAPSPTQLPAGNQFFVVKLLDGSLNGYAFKVLNASDSLLKRLFPTPLVRRSINKLGQGSGSGAPPLTERLSRHLLLNVKEPQGFVDGAPLDSFNSLNDFRELTIAQGNYSPVVAVYTSHYSGTVYDLSVEHDESYVLRTGIVHNCRCTWFTLSQRDMDRLGLSLSDPLPVPEEKGWSQRLGLPTAEEKAALLAQVTGRMAPEIAAQVAKEIAEG